MKPRSLLVDRDLDALLEAVSSMPTLQQVPVAAGRGRRSEYGAAFVIHRDLRTSWRRRGEDIIKAVGGAPPCCF